MQLRVCYGVKLFTRLRSSYGAVTRAATMLLLRSYGAVMALLWRRYGVVMAQLLKHVTCGYSRVTRNTRALRVTLAALLKKK